MRTPLIFFVFIKTSIYWTWISKSLSWLINCQIKNLGNMRFQNPFWTNFQGMSRKVRTVLFVNILYIHTQILIHFNVDVYSGMVSDFGVKFLPFFVWPSPTSTTWLSQTVHRQWGRTTPSAIPNVLIKIWIVWESFKNQRSSSCFCIPNVAMQCNASCARFGSTSLHSCWGCFALYHSSYSSLKIAINCVYSDLLGFTRYA